MSWIKKDDDVVEQEEMEGGINRINSTDAYEVIVEQAYMQESRTQGSKSISLALSVKDAGTDAVNTTYFTLTGTDGNTFYLNKKGEKNLMFGLSIVNTLFGIAIGKEIFDVQPVPMTVTKWNNEIRDMETVTADGFPDLIGKKVGICLQMYRKIEGADSKESGSITHFFDTNTGLFNKEVDSDNRKLDKWLNTKREFIVKEVKEAKSSFGNKKERDDTNTPKKGRWGR